MPVRPSIEYHVFVRYIGSKVSAVERITSAIPNLHRFESLCDPFAGVCTVARHFKSLGFRTVTGDLLRLSFVFQKAYLGLNDLPKFSKLLRSEIAKQHVSNSTPVERVLTHLNSIPPADGFITREYSLAGAARRKFFTIPNARTIDAIRAQISEWADSKLVNDDERDYLLACLVDAADAVANTAGTYYAYLRKFYRKARKRLALRPLHVADNGEQNVVCQRDASDLVAETKTDILYLDPPYNDRDYSAYYHLAETIVRGDEPEVFGTSGARRDLVRSAFCRPRHAEEAITGLIASAKARVIVLHYVLDGLASHGALLSALKKRGTVRWTDWTVRSYRTSREASPTSRQRLYICTT
jgi:adenine-specific DNA-methyltransferase